jgi:hypothetical protein
MSGVEEAIQKTWEVLPDAWSTNNAGGPNNDGSMCRIWVFRKALYRNAEKTLLYRGQLKLILIADAARYMTF